MATIPKFNKLGLQHCIFFKCSCVFLFLIQFMTHKWLLHHCVWNLHWIKHVVKRIQPLHNSSARTLAWCWSVRSGSGYIKFVKPMVKSVEIKTPYMLRNTWSFTFKKFISCTFVI
jgi:hypothetical protein